MWYNEHGTTDINSAIKQCIIKRGEKTVITIYGNQKHFDISFCCCQKLHKVHMNEHTISGL